MVMLTDCSDITIAVYHGLEATSHIYPSKTLATVFSLFLIFHVVYINTLQRTVGAHCRVAEPLFGSEFNLNPLRKVAEDYHVHYQEYDYILNICGPLNQACGSSSDVAVCQTKPNDDGFTPVDAGKNLFHSLL